MRYIPEDILEKIKSNYLTKYKNSQPRLKAIAKRGFDDDLFKVYTIHEEENSGPIDITVRRPAASSSPDRAFISYEKDGDIFLKSKALPYDRLTPWKYEFFVGSGTETAIELNGYWERDQESKRFNFIGEDKPWVFWVDSGDLKAAHWQDTPNILASGVSKIAAIRGWVPVEADNSNDQGLICAYIKGGDIYYRNYTVQAGGGYAWESEKQVTKLNHGNYVDVALFRTNDFRIGFIGQTSTGSVYWVVTDRNYAGMSYYPENNVGIIGANIDYVEISRISGYNTTDNNTAEIGNKELAFCKASDPEPGVMMSYHTPDNSLILEFNTELLNVAGNEAAFTAFSGSTELTVSAINSVNNHTIEIVISETIQATDNIDVSYDYQKGTIQGKSSETCIRYLRDFTETVFGEPYFTPNENNSAAIGSNIDFTYIETLEGIEKENNTANINSTIEFWEADNAPL